MAQPAEARIMSARAYLICTGIAVAVIAASLPVHSHPDLIWNASASVPTGLYAVRPQPHYQVGELVAATPATGIAPLLVQRGYLPTGVPLLKHVAATRGHIVCRLGLRITVNGRLLGVAKRRDRLGRFLPVWEGCQKLGATQIFLMNVDVHDSLDGRYFGPLSTASIIGRLHPVWTDDDGTGARRWHGFAMTPANSPNPQGEEK